MARDPWRVGVLFSRSGVMEVVESELFRGVRLQAAPFVMGMPRRDAAAGAAPAEVTAMLALSPPQRPGGGGSAQRLVPASAE